MSDRALVPLWAFLRQLFSMAVEFFYLKKRPDIPSVRESFTLQEVEAAYEQGRDLSTH